MSDAPLITHLYTADPSAHVFDGRLYVYPSHDWESGVPADDTGAHFQMRDYHVFSMATVGGPVTDHGVALALEEVPWADRQLWAPDAAQIGDRYLLYFPAKDKAGVFRIGVALSERPEGPFVADPEPIAGTYSIDPCSFVDSDGAAYLYVGGIWGGQLQGWRGDTYDPSAAPEPTDGPALGPKVARLSGDGRALAEPLREVSIVDESGAPLRADDHDRRFFEGAWVHKANDLYYLSYSTGDTHFLVYATSASPYGPFVWRGRLLEPVVGWTTHHSIVEYDGRWWLFHHDATLSGGQTHLRCVKVKELVYDGLDLRPA